jgi:hypothetical protein
MRGTAGEFDRARGLLASDLHTDVPINTYGGRADFADAVARTASLAHRVEVLAAFGAGEHALLLYDMHTRALGRFRVAEQLTVHDGRISHIRHVHDTAALRGITGETK